MQKLLIFLAVVLIIVGVWFVFFRSNQPTVATPSDMPSESAMSTATASPSPSPSASVMSGSVKVSIENFAFSPAQITITKGTKVTWKNEDHAPHQPVSDSGKTINSPSLPYDGSYSVTFNQAGTYTYHCAIHPSMTATIVVQ